MKRLFINNNRTEHFFSENVDAEELAEWLIDSGYEVLDPSEWYSCKTTVDGNTVCVSGDEDYFECTLETVITEF